MGYFIPSSPLGSFWRSTKNHHFSKKKQKMEPPQKNCKNNVGKNELKKRSSSLGSKPVSRWPQIREGLRTEDSRGVMIPLFCGSDSLVDSSGPLRDRRSDGESRTKNILSHPTSSPYFLFLPQKKNYDFTSQGRVRFWKSAITGNPAGLSGLVSALYDLQALPA